MATDEDFKKAMENTINLLKEIKETHHAGVVFEAGTRIKDLERKLSQMQTTLTRTRGQLDTMVDRSNNNAGKLRALNNG